MYKLHKLDFLFQDVEPFIDIHTMGVHYYRHHNNYLKKLNVLLTKNNYKYNYSLSELVLHVDEFPEKEQKDILYNLGGVINHNLYWNGINPNIKQKPFGKFKYYLENTFGSYEEFWKKMKKKALKLQGAGYTFLVLSNRGELKIINLPNQDTPILLEYIPLFNIDMWEHAYYLNYVNDKEKYLDELEKIVDFTYASEIFNKIV